MSGGSIHEEATASQAMQLGTDPRILPGSEALLGAPYGMMRGVGHRPLHGSGTGGVPRGIVFVNRM